MKRNPDLPRRLQIERLGDRRLMTTIAVDSLLDNFDVANPTTDGLVTLREAIMAANADAAIGDAAAGNGADSIEFSPALDGRRIRLDLAFGELAIVDSLTVDASSLANGITIDAADGLDGIRGTGDGIRIFRIDDRDDETHANVELIGLTLTRGDTDGRGGAIFTSENLLVSSATLSRNAALDGGGAISTSYNQESGSLTIRDSTISANSASHGGGISKGSRGGSLTIHNSTISANTASGDGGGISTNLRGAVEIRETTISGNSSHFSSGGGINVLGTGNQPLSIEGSTLSGNSAAGRFFGSFYGGGGGLAMEAPRSEITINATTISDNETHGNGGGIYSRAKEVTLTSTTVSGNLAHRNGGGIYVYGRTSFIVQSSVVSANITSASGGGFSVDKGPVAVSSSTIVDNVAAQYGGGFYLIAERRRGTGLIERTTISANSAVDGAGIFASLVADKSSTTVLSSTLSGNVATGRGGGMFVSAAKGTTLNVGHSTVSTNQGGSGGGVYIEPLPGSVALAHSIVAQNYASGGNRDDVFGTAAMRYILIGDSTGATISGGEGNLVGTSGFPIFARLGPLADHGGPTKTHALTTGSPAINAGDVTLLGGVNGAPEYDQRGPGFARVFDNRVDIGALELQQAVPDCDFDGDGACNVTDIDALVAEIASATHDATFDLNLDGQVNLADRDQWLVSAGAANLTGRNRYLLGDANLDGVVDGLDFIDWNRYKFTSVAAWSVGDFNADGMVDEADFVIWDSHKFQTTIPDTTLANRHHRGRYARTDLWGNDSDLRSKTPSPRQRGDLIVELSVL